MSNTSHASLLIWASSTNTRQDMAIASLFISIGSLAGSQTDDFFLGNQRAMDLAYDNWPWA
jgi:hypothetical protein